MSEPSMSDQLLSRLRSADESEFRQALEDLTDLLVSQARAELAGKRDRVDVIPESVAQSVIVGELGQLGSLRIENGEHLIGRMRLAIRHKIRTRLRKGGKAGQPIQSSQASPNSLTDGASQGPGPGTVVASRDEQQNETTRASKLRQRLLAGQDPQAQQMIEFCVFRGWDARRAAEHIGCSHDALRARLSRAKKALRTALLDPVRAAVEPQQWAILNGVLIEQIAPSRLSSVLGLTPEELSSSFEDLLSGAVLDELGADGMEVLHRLLGRTK